MSALHWICNPLDGDALAVLRRVRDRRQPLSRDRFLVAYLIARDCVAADVEERSLAITEKGLDGLAFFDPAPSHAVDAAVQNDVPTSLASSPPERGTR